MIKNRKNKQKRFYSGKKKKYTLKTQVVVDKKTKQVICTVFTNDKSHDFKLFQESKTMIRHDIILGGIQSYMRNLSSQKRKARKIL